MKAPLSLAALCLVGAFTAPSRGATPVDELLRYVPADVSFCLVVRDLRGHAKALGDSPFATAFRRSPLGLALAAAPELAAFEKGEQFLEKTLGTSLERLREDILGDAIVFAYRPGGEGKTESEQGLVLVRARAAKPLADLVERVNRVMKDSGMLKEVTEVEHDGFKYSRRVEGAEVNFLHLRGPVLIFSGQESMLREALATEKKLPAEREPPVSRSLRDLGAERALATFWVNPRAFDADLARSAENAGGDEKAFLKTFAGCWKALDATAFTLSLGRDLEIGLAVRGRPEALPAAVRRFLDDSSGPSDLWGRFPEDALFSLGGRALGLHLLELLGAFVTKQAFETTQEELNRSLASALGKDRIQDVLPYVGPDWGVCVTAPPTDHKAWFPSMLFALRVAAGDPAAPVDQGIVTALHSYATFAVLGLNRMRKDPLILKTARQDRLEVRYLASATGQAMGLQPAFGLCDGYLVVASTPETIRRFASLGASKTKPTEVPLLRVSLRHLREYLKDRRDVLAAALASQNQQPPKQIAQHLDGLGAALELFDRLELVQKTAPGHAAFTLRLRPTQPLRK